MAMMLASLYDALRDANVPEEKARRAAEEVADFERKIGELRTDFTELKGKMNTVQALLGVVILIGAATIWQLVALNGTVARLDERMTAMEARIGTLETRIGTLETRIGALETGQAAIQQRLGTIESQLRGGRPAGG
jgi:phage shock protein A